MARVVVDVMLKPEILDPQGRAVKGALTRIGLAGVADVRQGKQFIIDLDTEVDDAVLAQLHELAADLLSNPVIEDYELSVDVFGGEQAHPDHTGTAVGASSDAVVK